MVKSMIAVTFLAGLTLVLGKKLRRSPHKSGDEPQLRIDDNTISEIEEKAIFAVDKVKN